MERAIMTSEAFLRRPSDEATEDDLPVAADLMDTLAAHADSCAGMAANMIGVAKRIIVFHDETTGRNMTMFNPVVTAKSGRHETEEGCLSLRGVRPAVRYGRITVTYRTRRWREATATFDGFTAEIIQHEIDHCDGILI